MYIDQLELTNWEHEQFVKESKKLYGVKRESKDPKKNKDYEYALKRRRYIHWYKKEHSWVRRNYQKKFRQEWRQEIKKGDWHRPINKEYHTYGYLTW